MIWPLLLVMLFPAVLLLIVLDEILRGFDIPKDEAFYVSVVAAYAVFGALAFNTVAGISKMAGAWWPSASYTGWSGALAGVMLGNVGMTWFGHEPTISTFVLLPYWATLPLVGFAGLPYLAVTAWRLPPDVASPLVAARRAGVILLVLVGFHLLR